MKKIVTTAVVLSLSLGACSAPTSSSINTTSPPKATKEAAKKKGDGSFGSGTYEVGKEIKPGKYKTTGGDGCYWARLKDFSGDDLPNANGIVNGPTTIVIKKTDKGVEFQGSCKWKVQP